MALNIKDASTEQLARELAAATGESLTQATRAALAERLQRVRVVPNSASELEDIIARGRARSLIDARPEAAILGYGADGLPS